MLASNFSLVRAISQKKAAALLQLFAPFFCPLSEFRSPFNICCADILQDRVQKKCRKAHQSLLSLTFAPVICCQSAVSILVSCIDCGICTKVKTSLNQNYSLNAVKTVGEIYNGT